MKHSDLTPCVALTGSPREPEHVCISVKASRLSCALSFLPSRTGDHGSSMSCTSLLALNISPTLSASIHVSVYTIRYLPERENPRVSRAGVVEGSSLRALPLPLSQQCLPIPVWVQAWWNHAVCWDPPARRKGRRRQCYNIQATTTARGVHEASWTRKQNKSFQASISNSPGLCVSDRNKNAFSVWL